MAYPTTADEIPRTWGGIARNHPTVRPFIQEALPGSFAEIAQRVGAKHVAALAMAKQLGLEADRACGPDDVIWLTEVFDRVRCRVRGRHVKTKQPPPSPPVVAPVPANITAPPNMTLTEMKVFYGVRRKALVKQLERKNVSFLMQYEQIPIPSEHYAIALDVIVGMRKRGSGKRSRYSRSESYAGSSGPSLLTVDGSSYW